MIRRKNKPPTKSAVDYIELLYNKYAPKLKYVAKQYIHNDTLLKMYFKMFSRKRCCTLKRF